MHDGSNIISKEPISVGDSVLLDLAGKIKKHIPLERGREAIIIEGKYLGLNGKIENVKDNLITIKIEEKTTMLPKRQVIAR